MTNLSDRNDWENVDTLGKLLDSTLPSAKEFIGNFDDLLKFLKEKGCNILPASKNATGTRMLEIGSGKGHFVTAMKKRGYDILGIDLVTTNPDGTPRAPADAALPARMLINFPTNDMTLFLRITLLHYMNMARNDLKWQMRCIGS